MKVEIFAFCDYATRADRKLTLVGVFDRVTAPALPTSLPTIGIGFKLRLEENDLSDVAREFSCKLESPKKKVILEVRGSMVMQRPKSAANDPAGVGTADFAVTLPGAKFEEHGVHVATLTFDGKKVGETSILVAQA